MASSPITSSQIEGGKVEAVTDFLFLGSIITVDGDCSHGISRWLLLDRNAIANLDSQNLFYALEMLNATKYNVEFLGTECPLDFWWVAQSLFSFNPTDNASLSPSQEMFPPLKIGSIRAQMYW